MQSFKTLFFLILFSTLHCDDLLNGHHQLIVVTAPGWENNQGSLQLYERSDDNASWTPASSPMSVVLGASGLAWGIGLHPIPENTLPSKIEGDQKSPAGIFSLGTAFGFAPLSAMTRLHIDYLLLHSSLEAVDDPLSSYYNQIVDSQIVASDWNSSEKLSEEPLYELGLVIHHNFPNPKPGAGSAIFFHFWHDKTSGTAGCTAMSPENLHTVLSWLDQSKNPLLVQLPISQYNQLQSTYNLPQ